MNTIEVIHMENCQIRRFQFNQITSHLKSGNMADLIEADILEDNLDVCK